MKNVTRSQIYDARDQFASMLSKKTKEAEWQRFFSDNPFVFSEALPLRLEPEDIVPRGRPGKSEPDFIFYPKTPSSNPFCGAIEIKKPSSKIITLPRKQIITLTRDADTAIKQATIYAGQTYKDHISSDSNYIFLGNRIYAFVIMGLSDELAKLMADEHMAEQLTKLLPSNCHLLPFDELYRLFNSKVPPRIFSLYPALDDFYINSLTDNDYNNFSEDIVLFPGQRIKYDDSIVSICCFVKREHDDGKYAITMDTIQPLSDSKPTPVYSWPVYDGTSPTKKIGIIELNSPIHPFSPKNRKYNSHAASIVKIMPDIKVCNTLPQFGTINGLADYDEMILRGTRDIYIVDGGSIKQGRIDSVFSTFYIKSGNHKFGFTDCITIEGGERSTGGSPVIDKQGRLIGMIFARFINRASREYQVMCSLPNIFNELNLTPLQKNN